MKLFEVMAAQAQVQPSMNPNMLAQEFATLNKAAQVRMLRHYKISNVAQLSSLPPQRVIDFSQDIEYVKNHGGFSQLGIDGEPEPEQNHKPIVVPPINMLVPQAGYNPGDEQRYPPTSASHRQAG